MSPYPYNMDIVWIWGHAAFELYAKLIVDMYTVAQSNGVKHIHIFVGVQAL